MSDLRFSRLVRKTMTGVGAQLCVLNLCALPVSAYAAQSPDYLFSFGANTAVDFGEDVSAAGDFDGDGSLEVWVSNDGSWGGPYEARLYSLADGALLRTINSSAAHFGHAVETLGDIDGDGVTDYIVSAPQANGNRGLAQVRSGADDSIIRVHQAAGTAPDDRFGNSVNALGDVNQDGVPDYAITASSEDPVGSGAHYVGSLRFYSGSDGAELSLVMGAGGGHYAGNCAPGSDYDGDGLMELVNRSFAGYVRIHDHTGAIALEITTGLSGDLGAIFLDDHDGDGIAEVLVHSHQSRLMRIFSGSDGSLVREISPPPGLVFNSFGREGVTNICTVPDLDGDGLEDIVFGEHSAQKVVMLSSASGAILHELQHPVLSGAPFGNLVRFIEEEEKLLVTSLNESVHVYRMRPEDCNSNGVPDSEDIADGTSADCDGNGIPDECDLVAGTSFDCNANGVPDICEITGGSELDCNGNGVPDSCDLAAGTSFDCDSNGIPDECDIAAGATDCDADGVPDACQITGDATLDLNANGVLDSCEAVGTNYCSPAFPNSTGAPAEILALGSDVLASSDVSLAVRGLPASSFAMFVTSQSQGYAFPIPGSQGALCVVGFPGRFDGPGQVKSSGSSGSLMLALDLSSLPTSVGFTAALPGQTWNFQAWYRDANPTATSNFTDAVSITFQ